MLFQDFPPQPKGGFCLAFTFGENDKIVGIASQTLACLRDRLVEGVQIDIGEQGR